MNSHWAWLKLLDKLNIGSVFHFDQLQKMIGEHRFEFWDQIEAVFFCEGWFLSEKKEDVKNRWQKEREQIQKDIDSGFQYLGWGEEDYPRSFQNLLNPPLVFSFFGKKCWKGLCLSVVGSREPHPYTVAWMKTELRALLKQFSLTVVSGGARGVDFMAHSLCLDLGLPTVVILPSGLREIYPPSLKKSLNRVLECGGVFLSEYDSDFQVRKHLFQHRNRLIAAMNQAVIVAEARRQSGTVMTGHIALEMGKPVWVVPGHPLMNSFAGSLDLMTRGGQMVRNTEDLKMFFECELNSYNSFRVT